MPALKTLLLLLWLPQANADACPGWDPDAAHLEIQQLRQRAARPLLESEHLEHLCARLQRLQTCFPPSSAANLQSRVYKFVGSGQHHGFCQPMTPEPL
ncbi:hypothetical protein [Pseudomonas fontis]|uniref:Lipoprotein n=1 Tax=Pseudomonas fontis TaxID=2942633 RepID=A0ABT5NLQ3_9PSED|nr:hypothetical protein [Pseudomonas fontis]MDD0977207.1 hypothetical protein [Pseudomonas fontis]MDD0989276.1 hypothetical protein [Pseudomonas fontis]